MSTDLSGAVARSLQSLRAERGWSLDQLAHRSGVSKGVLVAIEQERSNPNLATLARISDAFGVPVTRLIDVPDEPAVRITGPDQARTLWRGPSGGTGTIMTATEPPWAVEMWRWVLLPGEHAGGDAHGSASKEMIWVQSGTITLTVAGHRYQVTAGQCARFSGGEHHSYANEGDEPAEMTMVVVVPPAVSLLSRSGVDRGQRKCFELVMGENWDADARVGVPMIQMIAKQVSQCKDRPRAVRQIIDQQWLDEDSKQQLRETFRVTDADLVRYEREAALEARRRTRERYGTPVPTGPCDCDAEPVVDPSGRISCRRCGAEWTALDVRQVIDAQFLDEDSKQQLRETFRVTDADLAAREPQGPGLADDHDKSDAA